MVQILQAPAASCTLIFAPQAGTGAFQRLLLLVVGLGLAADTIELFVVAYVIPSAEVELCMSGTEKGWLGK